MAATVSLESPQRPRDGLVSLRLEAEPWSRLSPELVRDLRLRLTNHEVRGDFKDDGNPAGSLMKELIDESYLGFVDTSGWWTVTAWPEGSRWKGPVAWCLLRPVPRAVTTFALAFYTAPGWRKRGVGRLLLNETLRLARRLSVGRLEASPWNVSSHAFFGSAGFKAINVIFSQASELDVPMTPPERLPWRCRAPETT